MQKLFGEGIDMCLRSLDARIELFIRGDGMMQRMKDYMNKVQAFIVEKRNFWYWVVMLIALMMFANTELLSIIIPIWATYLVNVVLIIVTTVYARLLIANLKERIKENKAEDESKLYDFLEQSFKNTDEAVRNVDEKITSNTELIQKELCSSKEMILTDIEAKKNDIFDELANVQKHEDEVHDLLKNRIEQLESASKENLENNTTNVLNTVKATEICLSQKLSEQTDFMNRNEESNKINIDESRKVLLQEIRSNGNKADVNTTNINKNIEEVRDMLAESVTKLLETTDVSLQAVKKENIDNIAIQTKELITKLDSILAENKNSSIANLEEIQKTCDIIVDKITDVDEANQVKEQEYYNDIEEKLNTSDDKMLRGFANIKEQAKEMEEKRAEADSAAFDSVHVKANEILSSSGDLANKINTVSEALEGFEQRAVSAIAESSATVLKEVKDGVIQSTSHMNDASEKVIKLIKKNDNDTVEKLNNQSQEILSAISENNAKGRENYNSLVDVLREVKLLLNEAENEILTAEKGNAQLAEELKKSIASELQSVGDGLSKIEGIQNDNVVQIIELVDSKLLELNQELVKKANSILDKSDENTDCVSEKFNRVFNQIQSVAKESKILINRVNDAIEENKNTILKSQNVVTDSIGSHFQEVKNKEKELESLEAVVERNLLNISSELEIARGQLSSLNSLSVLIKSLSEKREDKAEKKQNRIETIEDPDSGLTVRNEYKQDKLVTSQMFRGSKKIYDAVYGNRGEILSTKNYDELGKVSIEMTYHSNGQVKERIEYISGKVERSKFDANGNKIK